MPTPLGGVYLYPAILTDGRGEQFFGQVAHRWRSEEAHRWLLANRAAGVAAAGPSGRL
jgi:hypothetical protein